MLKWMNYRLNKRQQQSTKSCINVDALNGIGERYDSCPQVFFLLSQNIKYLKSKYFLITLHGDLLPSAKYWGHSKK